MCTSWIAGRFQPGPWSLIPSNAGPPNVVTSLSNGSAVLALASGLLLYAAGLFAPIRSRR